MAGKYTKTPMDAERLRLLLQSKETGTLEFKQEWYKIEDAGKASKWQKGELTKDILSLANGNAIVAGEEAYLIIGAHNELNAEGTRNLLDVDQTNITPLRILQIVNRVCDPPLEEINCDTIYLNEKRVVVITIPPAPHLYETTDKLQTSADRIYDKHTVFVRHSEGIDTASSKEREKILKLKQIAFSERRNAPPQLFGAVVGAVAGGVIASSLPGAKLVISKAHWPISALIGIGLGGFVGWCSGYFYSSYYGIRSKWYRVSVTQRVMGIIGGLAGGTGTWLVFRLIKKALKKQAATGTGPGNTVNTWLGL